MYKAVRPRKALLCKMDYFISFESHMNFYASLDDSDPLKTKVLKVFLIDKVGRQKYESIKPLLKQLSIALLPRKIKY